ncbi:NADH-quinone oxidoreductase subunit N [Paenibacillus tarimensis]|uniref:NADH-quinone oxidoreductase subunit N n=1 Tax=Paenibacillus tarimensis TaxID=416012 RepID=UPI001F27D143|nr:NADH-quinone oxidoreductase subunit N [Paenibacillus tarimensis]MCF2944163.1 NADH-quinone oxidoreductase subunit N [Paenibacillus tarimensis]
MTSTDLLQGLTWQDVGYLAPEITLIAMAVLVTLLDLALPDRINRAFTGWFTLLGILGSLGFVCWHMLQLGGTGDGAGPGVVRLLGDSYRVDGYASVFKIILLGASALIILPGIRAVQRDEKVTDKGEAYTLMLPAAAGALVMCSTGDLITLFVGLELLSISTYVLVGIRKWSGRSQEGAFKYLVMGGISSAFILFGMSYIYGVTGSTNYGAIGGALTRALSDYEALVYVGFFFLIGGFAVKLAAFPFHAWAPDVYQGAPASVTAFLAVVTKGAFLAALLRFLFNTALPQMQTPFGEDILLALKLLAGSAMIAGTTAALRQRNMKRLLALSGTANTGYMLVPLAVGVGGFVQWSNAAELGFYLIAYALMATGVFTVHLVISREAGHDEMSGYAGLYYRAPWTAWAMVILLLSLAGIPLTAGFLGKLFILLSSIKSSDYWLAGIMLLSSVISYYFYFAIIRQMFMRAGETERRIPMPLGSGLTIWVCVSATITLGLFPGLAMNWMDSTISVLRDILLG